MNKITCIYLCRILLNRHWSYAEACQTRHTYIKKRPTTEIYEQIHTNMYVYATETYIYIYTCMYEYAYLHIQVKPES